eukprot:TRINITY_DN5832_c0_g1_i1.p1 TRINITY_DN5832_c0_g1~~TRINITY_DN5832_c0_g1_i1.p1  ORF type:complete len:514 (+),score=70.23 TRINITY_DN5832_c0_g1_i1:81-1544(+)
MYATFCLFVVTSQVPLESSSDSEYNVGVLFKQFAKLKDSVTEMEKENMMLQAELSKIKSQKQNFGSEGKASKLSYSKSTKRYIVNPNPSCWLQSCDQDMNNIQAYVECRTPEATKKNRHGVLLMENYLDGDLVDKPVENRGYLVRAINKFIEALQSDDNCAEVHVNLALAYLANGEARPALEQMNSAIRIDGNNARYYAIRSFLNEINGDYQTQAKDLSDALNLDKYISERRYFGFLLTNTTTPEKHVFFPVVVEYGRDEEREVASKILVYKELARATIASHHRVTQSERDFFIENGWFVLRNILPTYARQVFAHGFRQLIKNGRIELGDSQAKRYRSMNDRISRILHFALVDLGRSLIAHEIVPTYTYFGGYVEGAELEPHSDRPQCEFTMSLTLEQFPIVDDPWELGLGYKPLFEKNDTYSTGTQDWPGEEDQRWAHLYAGDGLMFMGRHLIHFRRGLLGEGRWLNQVFLHHVNHDFESIYDPYP